MEATSGDLAQSSPFNWTLKRAEDVFFKETCTNPASHAEPHQRLHQLNPNQ